MCNSVGIKSRWHVFIQATSWKVERQQKLTIDWEKERERDEVVVAFIGGGGYGGRRVM